MDGRWSPAPRPAPDGGYPGVSLAGGGSLAMFRRSPRQDAAWRLIEYLSEPAQQVRFYQLTGDLPARRQAWTEAALERDPQAGAFWTQLEAVRATPKIPEWERIATEITRHAEAAVRGTMTADEALGALDGNVDALLAKRRWLLGGCRSDHGGCGERSGGCERGARSSVLRRARRHASSVVAALPALAPRLVRLARHDHPGRLLGRRAADAPCRLLIGVFDAAEVAPEAVLVELLARPLVPEAAGVGADLVGEQDLAVMAAELELHVDQHDVALVEVLAQERIHAQRRLVDGGELVRRGEAQKADVPVVDHRVVERVVLVEVLEDGLGERLALRAPEALGEAPGDDVARHHLDLHDLAAADQHVALGEAAHEVGRHALLLEEAGEDLGHAVVEDALVDDRAALLRVEGGGVVLEVLDEEVGIGSGVELLRLALVEQLTAIHRRPPRRARREPGYAAGGAPCQRGWRDRAASDGGTRRGRPRAASGSLRRRARSAAPSGRPRRD